MLNKMQTIWRKSKIIIMLAAISGILVLIYFYNGSLKNDIVVIKTEDGTYLESSGTVDSNSVIVSSEVVGTIMDEKVAEGEKVKSGQIIAGIDNRQLKSQIELIENNIKNLTKQNADSAEQAYNGYLSAKAQYEKVKGGADPDEIKRAEEVVNQAEISSSYLKTILDKYAQLLEAGVISQREYDEAQKNYNISQSQHNSAVSSLNLIKSQPKNSDLETAKTKMLQAKAAYDFALSSGETQVQQLQKQLESAKEQYDKTTIKSPIDGIINELFLKSGEFVSVGRPVAEICIPDNVEINAYVSDANIGYVKVNQEVEVTTDANNGHIFKGKVIKINDEAEFTPKNIQTKEERVNTVFKVKIKVLNPGGKVKPGMPVDVKIKIDQR